MATASTPQAGRQDPIKVDQKHYTVELENNRVRVLRVRYGPHEKSSMHAHPALVGISLTDSRVRFSYPDGKTENAELKAGQVLSYEPVVHLPENLSDKPLEIILVELKT